MNVLGLMLSIGAVTFGCAFPQMKGSCKSPPRFEHAELTGDSKKESFPMGQVVHYNCRPGYARLGAIRFICSEGKWLRLGIGECKKKSCGNPGEIDFGTFKLKNEEAFIFGAIVEYSCEPGYQMVSKYNSIECTATGWSRALPHCEAKLCPPVVDDSVRVLSTVYDDEYTAGHVINLECKNPNKKLNGPSQIHCTSDGTWNVDPPTCKDSCSIRYNEMEQYNLQVKNNQKLRVKHNELIEFECIPRYEISDPKNLIITCNDGVITYPACYLKAKLSPRVVDDSVRVLSNVYDEEYTAEHKGKKKSCPPPLEVQNGEWMGEKKQMYDSGSTIQFKCVSYYKRQGKEKIKCRNGIWDEPPYCLVPCILNSNYIKGNNTALVKAGEKYVEHGKPVKFRCLQTFGISDVKLLNVKCLNGTLKYPKCVKMEPCVLNDDYLKGNNTIVHASKMNFEHGESVKFKCLPTFNISDSKLLNGKCLDGKLKYPKCVKTGLCSLNEMTMLENNITVKSGNKHCGNQKVQNKCGIKENETIEFACLPDYETSEHEKLKVKCLNGVIEYPKCFKITTDEITVQPSVESEPNIY